MPTYYTVDRENSLVAGQQIELKSFKDIAPEYLQRHLDELFPLGVSLHGEKYLVRGDSTINKDPVSEMEFEYVRRSIFPERPSRFVSMFALRTVEEAQAFRERFKAPNARIWEVAAASGFVADMRLIGPNNSSLVRSCFANMYWKGEESPLGDPVWEVLLELPVNIVRQVVLPVPASDPVPL